MKHIIRLSFVLLLCLLTLFSWVYGEEVSMDGADTPPGENELPLDWESTPPGDLTWEEAYALINAQNRSLYDLCALDEADADSPSMLPSKEIESDAPEIIALAKEICAGLSTDYDKIQAIYSWVSDNIFYDWEHYYEITDKDFATSALEVLETKLGVCSGFANLSAALCRAAGIPCRPVTGLFYDTDLPFYLSNDLALIYTYQDEYRVRSENVPRPSHLTIGGHAWNMALADGRWIIFDSTNSKFDLDPDTMGAYYLSQNLTDPIDYKDCHIQINYSSKILKKYFGNTPILNDLPDFITVIDELSFKNNTTLEEIVLPPLVHRIGRSAFSGCTSLRTVACPDNIKSFPYGVFEDCVSLTTINTPATLTLIDYRAFANCKSLLAFDFPEGLKTIKDQVFYGCSSLKSIDLSGTQVEELLNAVFSHCTSIESIKLPSNLKIMGSLAFYDCNKLTTISLPNSVTRIEDGAFSHCTGLRSITIPNNVEYIGYRAFEQTVLTTVVLPDSVREIGEYAFTQCPYLTSVEANGVEVIGGYAFYESPLESFTFGPKIRTIGEKAFCGTPIQEAILPEGLETLELEVFYGCPNLTRAHIPSTLNNARDAFEGSALTDVTFALGRDTIPERLFNGCKFLQKIQIPDGVKTIAPTVFQNCYALTEVTLPEGLERIQEYSFSNCTGLVSVRLPKTLTYIGYNAFSGCAKLAQIAPPDTLEYIGSNAFHNTAFLKNKDNWSADGALYFADALVSVRANTAGTFIIPESIKTIAEKAFSGCTLLKHITIPVGIGTIAERQFQGCTGLKSIDLPKDLTTIGKYAFYKCTALETLAIPEGVKNIPMFMCDGCTGLKELSLPRGLQSIDSCAFRYCSSLTSVELPESLTQILGSAFYGCTGLTEIEIPAAVSQITGDSFSKCTSLKAFRIAPESRWFSTDEKGVLFNKKQTLLHTYPGGLEGSYTVPETVETIGDYAFANCKGLTAVTLPTGLLIIGNSAFENCAGLTAVDFPLTLKEIGCSAFYGCVGLTEVVLPHSLNLLDGAAFSCCDNLKDMTIYSDNCYIDDFIVYTMGIPGTTTIHADSGSYAESRAKSNGFTFELLEKPILDETIAIYHSLNLASDISINYAVATKDLASYDSFFLKCSLPERLQNKPWQEAHLVILPEKKGDYYYFTLDGLTAIELGEVLTARLYMEKDGVYYTSAVDRYSVATYALSQLNRDGMPQELRTLCTDLLRYGSAAQIWKGYKTYALADKDLEESYKEQYQTDLETITFGNNNRVLNDLPNPSVKWVGKALSLENRVIVRFIFNPAGFDGYPEDLSLRITYTNPKGQVVTHIVTDCTVYNKDLGLYAFDYSGLNASDLRCVLSATVYTGDTQVSPTLEYSPDTYGNKKTDALLTLCKAMIAYSDSAAAFFAS